MNVLLCNVEEYMRSRIFEGLGLLEIMWLILQFTLVNLEDLTFQSHRLID